MDTLRETLDWIDTLADDQGLSHEHREVATVIARRRLTNEPDALPKTLARNALDDAADHVDD